MTIPCGSHDPHDSVRQRLWTHTRNARLRARIVRCCTTSKHRAFWTHTDEDKQCGCQDECGDGLDNDCDGTADEAECVRCEQAEICGDGIDNDGDGAIDVDDAACAVPR
jgi:hypothetical protein